MWDYVQYKTFTNFLKFVVMEMMLGNHDFNPLKVQEA